MTKEKLETVILSTLEDRVPLLNAAAGRFGIGGKIETNSVVLPHPLFV